MGTRSGFANKLIMLVLLAVLVFAVFKTQTRINAIRTDARLTDTAYVKNAPPVVAFVTVALGSFRGLLADILWLRATALQDQGQYFEMVQLATWITELQPRFTGAIAYLAWNMAYNISFTCSSFEDRWRWVNQGIKLIRDKALQYNPGDPILYKELGWIYQHKIGNFMDDANRYYKNRMALDLMRVFGTDPDWKKLATAPKSEKAIAAKLGLDGKFWAAVAADAAKSGKKGGGADKWNMNVLEKRFREADGVMPECVVKALGGEKGKVDSLENYLRAKWIREELKLDPAYIFALNRRYGELDWRLPEAHAIYWASKGIDNDPNTGRVNEFCDRMVSQALKDACLGGKLLMVDPKNPYTFATVPNLALCDAVIKSFRVAYKRQNNDSFKVALEYFLADAVVTAYTFGKYSLAKKYFKILREEKPRDRSLRVGLDKFVIRKWKEDVATATPQQINTVVDGLVYRSAYLAACGENEASKSHLDLARGVYNLYKKQHRTTWKRVGLPPFDEIKAKASQRLLNSLAEISKLKNGGGEKQKRADATDEAKGEGAQ